MPLDINEVKDELNNELKSALEGLLKERDKKSDELHEQIEHLKTKSEEETSDIKGRIDEQKAEIEKLCNSIDEQMKKINRLGAANEAKSIGEQVIESEEFKGFDSGRKGNVSIEVKDILNSGNTSSATRSVLVAPHEGGFVTPPQQELRMRDVIPVAQVSATNAIRSIIESGYTNNADMVAEGAQKPQSELTFSEKLVPIEKIAHSFIVSMEVLDDAPWLRGHIDIRGRYGLELKEDDQILNGNGTTPNLQGIIPQATVLNPAVIPGYTPATLVDEIRVAKLQVRLAQYPASAVVMNPIDWALIELLKDTQGAYLYSSVVSGARPRLWGMDVVISDSIAQGQFLTGSFALAATIWDRMATTIRISTEDRDNFVKNMVTILLEKREALEVTRPEAFVKKV